MGRRSKARESVSVGGSLPAQNRRRRDRRTVVRAGRPPGVPEPTPSDAPQPPDEVVNSQVESAEPAPAPSETEAPRPRRRKKRKKAADQTDSQE